ncbi:oligopeptide ABC transporter ATP-binding protein OppF [Amycolatopsis deserti]|uniref:Oligopeptide ABC transporter ATP-binding protein OppF n=1 Tax=Amycolatopsis deserti TaxID=185696 RepID=A0ABQ3J437_9PSEU|nr:ABC transporter ATP-binding protein [Amycolatopsis deserti]GHE98722.1 oligopeptide ABC transporter ATP-binding protein OppF [Amycolatopsis deserti]
MEAAPTLRLRNLTVSFAGQDAPVTAVDDLSLDVDAGEVLAVVGESGSGKTTTFLSALGLQRGAHVTGQALLNGQDLLSASEAELSRLRGREVSVIFQDALASLNPVMAVGAQVAEAVAVHHRDLSRARTREKAVELLELVGIPAPRERAAQYPHELSGGMRQRVMIAIAIANEPRLIVADEPTTALDVTIQAQVIDVLRRIHERTDSSIVFITHDLGVVAGIADRVAVLYGGKLAELGTTEDVFYNASHPYTAGLLACLPRVDSGGRGSRLHQIDGTPPRDITSVSGCVFHPRCPMARLPSPCSTVPPPLIDTVAESGMTGEPHLSSCHFAAEVPQRADVSAPEHPGDIAVAHVERDDLLIEAVNVSKHFPLHKRSLGRGDRKVIRAVDNVSIEVARGETLGLVGESGSGKTTVAHMLVNLTEPTSGEISIAGKRLSTFSRKELRGLATRIQFVFQDPFSSLNPTMTVEQILAEPLKLNNRWDRKSSPQKIARMLRLVGLDEHASARHASAFSGGQRQRIGIARALMLEPQVLVLDEPVSALDVSVRAGIMNLLADLQEGLGVSYLFVAHDLAVVRHISDRVAVMYHGKIVEEGAVERLYSSPAHPYTVALLSSVPIPDPYIERKRERIILSGDQPSPANPPSGCRFRTRCWKAQDLCAEVEPAHTAVAGGGFVACHFPEATVADDEVSPKTARLEGLHG